MPPYCQIKLMENGETALYRPPSYSVLSVLGHVYPTKAPVLIPHHAPALPVLTRAQLGGKEIVAVCNAVSGAIRGC